MGRPKVNELTEREETLMNQLCTGSRAVDVARVFGITQSHVGNMIDRIRDKLGARTTYEAVAIFIRRNWN